MKSETKHRQIVIKSFYRFPGIKFTFVRQRQPSVYSTQPLDMRAAFLVTLQSELFIINKEPRKTPNDLFIL